MNRQEFKEILDFLKPAYQENSASGISQNIFFLNNSAFTFNGRILIQKELETGLEKVSVDFGKLFNFITKSKSKDISLKLVEDTLEIKAGKALLELKTTISPERFSARLKKITLKDKMKKLNNIKEFKRGLKLCKYSLRKDSASPLSNIFIDTNKVVGTDGRQISVFNLSENMDRFFIPFDIIPILEKYDFEGYFIEDDLIHFFADSFIFSFSNPGDVKFPNYINVLNIVDDTIDIIFEEDIKNNIDMTTIFDQKGVSDTNVKVKIDGNKCKITSKGNGGRLNIDTSVTSNECISFYINPIFFLSVLDITTTIKISNNTAYFEKDNYKYIFRINKGE
jgi:hypothetical protein